MRHEETFSGANRGGSPARRSPRSRPRPDPRLCDACTHRSPPMEYCGSTEDRVVNVPSGKKRFRCDPPIPRRYAVPRGQGNWGFTLRRRADLHVAGSRAAERCDYRIMKRVDMGVFESGQKQKPKTWAIPPSRLKVPVYYIAKSRNAYPNTGQWDHSTHICRKASFTSILLNRMQARGADGRRRCKTRQIMPRNKCFR